MIERKGDVPDLDFADAVGCVRCGNGADGICCTSHDKLLCHSCYRRTHFVEVCVEGCESCAREGLPVVLAR